MLAIEARGTSAFVISEDGRPVTELSRLPMTQCTIDGADYRFTREGGTRFWAQTPAATVGIAHRASRREASVSFAPHELQLRKGKKLGAHWEVREGEWVVGTCRVRVFSSEGDLSGHLPLPVRVFTCYVLLMMEHNTIGGAAFWS